MTPSERDKAHFEEWAESDGFDVRPYPNANGLPEYPFLHVDTNDAWRAWQAGVVKERERAARWIRLEEKLPEHRQKVLCFVVRRKAMNPQSWTSVLYYHDDDGFDIEDQSGGDPHVTHWKPLPSPPVAAAIRGSEEANG